MNPDEFRRHGHILVDWMADYLAGVAELPITPDVAPGQVRRAIPAAPPSAGEPFEALFRNFRELIVPGMTHWNHPGWFASDLYHLTPSGARHYAGFVGRKSA